MDRATAARALRRHGTLDSNKLETLPGDPLTNIDPSEQQRRELNRRYRQLRLSGETKLSYNEWLSEQRRP
ncbi:MAG TPA: hypothetical protein VGH62_11975 [Bradyrhizobium sp.]|jgi:hypothetical protein